MGTMEVLNRMGISRMVANPWYRKHELAESLERAERICRSNYVATNAGSSLEGEAVFTLLMICLDDVLQFLRKEGRRIAFSDDVEPIGGKNGDVTDLVHTFRNITCHIPSLLRTIEDKNGNMVRNGYTVAIGKVVAIKLGDLELGSQYADDVAILYGANRIYWTRHIVRATSEAREALHRFWV
ncbi:MAG: hypothetical protein WAM90_07700 [Rhodanobacter sp.]